MRRVVSVLGCAVAVSLFSGCSASGPVGNTHVPQPAKAVQLDRYTGLWYEIGRYENRFERGCAAVTARYTATNDGHIAILNTCHQQRIDGPVHVAHGNAKVLPGSNNAKLKVSFFGPFYVGDYWILDHDDAYRWSIVGEPSGRYLWILARSPHLEAADFTMLIDRAQRLGYNPALIHTTTQ